MKIVQQDNDDAVILLADLRIYSTDAITNTAYLFTGVCHVGMEPVDSQTIAVRLSAKTPGVVLVQTAKDFENELIDQQLRLRLRRETEDIRKTILSEAFAPLESVPDEE